MINENSLFFLFKEIDNSINKFDLIKKSSFLKAVKQYFKKHAQNKYLDGKNKRELKMIVCANLNAKAQEFSNENFKKYVNNIIDSMVKIFNAWVDENNNDVFIFDEDSIPEAKDSFAEPASNVIGTHQEEVYVNYTGFLEELRKKTLSLKSTPEKPSLNSKVNVKMEERGDLSPLFKPKPVSSEGQARSGKLSGITQAIIESRKNALAGSSEIEEFSLGSMLHGSPSEETSNIVSSDNHRGDSISIDTTSSRFSENSSEKQETSDVDSVDSQRAYNGGTILSLFHRKSPEKNVSSAKENIMDDCLAKNGLGDTGLFSLLDESDIKIIKSSRIGFLNP